MIAGRPGHRKSPQARVAWPAMPPTDRAAVGPTPDQTAQLLALADQCVQCGLCLPACPTYRFSQVEAESPRGRIALARAWALDTIPPTATGDAHLDHCLGCRSCEVVCPAGVKYGPLLVAARSRQRERRVPGWRQRSAEWLTARPRLLHALLRLYRLVFPLLPAGLRPLPRPPGLGSFPRLQGRTGMGAERSMKPVDDVTGLTPAPTLPHKREREQVAMFVGCVASTYESALRAALQQLCAATGVDVTIPRGQTCCGSLHAHAGNEATANTLAARNRAAFGNAGTVLTLASGCHEAVADALRGTVGAFDALDFLAARIDQLHFRARAERIALHLPCTQRNVVKNVAATRALLARVPGLEVVELDAGPLHQGMGCCGAAGTRMLLDRERAAAYRQPLLEQLEATGATRLLSANIGCRLHLANGTRLHVQHPLEFLAECLEP